MQAVILAGGKGTRLLPFTKVLPKPLVPLGEKPILDTILRQLKHCGFTRVTLVVGYMADRIQTYVDNGSRYGIPVQYLWAEEPCTVSSLALAHMREFDQDFLVMNGDVITNINYQELFAFHKVHQAVATIGTYRKKVQINFDLIHCNERSHITAYIEKSDQYFQVSMGMYVFRRDILSYMQPQQHMDFPGLLRRLLEDGQSVMSYPFNGYWLDIGNHSDYTRAVEEFEWMKDSLNIDYSREGGEVLRTEQG